MKRTRARRDLPPFSDATLRVPEKMHDRGCPGSVQTTGLPPSGRCRCDVATTIVPAGLEGQLHITDKHSGSSLVSFDGYGPTWVESKGLSKPSTMDPIRMTEDAPDSPVDAKSPKGKDRRPADIQLLERWMREHGDPKYGRRRRPIEGGELVFVRSDRMDGRFDAWRYVFCSRRDGEHVAVLVRPGLHKELAIAPDWNDVRCVQMTSEHNEPHRVLFPVFPLPDGEPDPGWSVP